MAMRSCRCESVREERSYVVTCLASDGSPATSSSTGLVLVTSPILYDLFRWT